MLPVCTFARAGYYCVSKKQWPISYRKLLYEMGNYFLDIEQRRQRYRRESGEYKGLIEIGRLETQCHHLFFSLTFPFILAQTLVQGRGCVCVTLRKPLSTPHTYDGQLRLQDVRRGEPGMRFLFGFFLMVGFGPGLNIKVLNPCQIELFLLYLLAKVIMQSVEKSKR